MPETPNFDRVFKKIKQRNRRSQRESQGCSSGPASCLTPVWRYRELNFHHFLNH